jgi:hypothetical protein
MNRESNCNNCVRVKRESDNKCYQLERRRKYAWGQYYEVYKELINITMEYMMKSDALTDNIKRSLRNVYYKQSPEDRTCVICLEEMKRGCELYILGCGHFFDKCIKHVSIRTCPMCRADIDKVYDL